ncbi:MAG: PolC-type DNA polymerase III [Oscillospiraceae bacterium]|nr:PolC-type DNA polymerase III [Oscillospiraceae bacterium]
MAAVLSDFIPGTYSSDAEIRKIEVGKDGETVSVILFSHAFDPDLVTQAKKAFSDRFPGRRIEIRLRFPQESFCGEALQTVIEDVKYTGKPVNGFFRNASMELEGEKVIIKLPNKTASILEEMDMPVCIQRSIYSMFGLSRTVEFRETENYRSAPVEDTSAAVYSDSFDRSAYIPPKKGKTLNKSDMSNKAIALEDDGYELVMGKKPSLSSIIPIDQALSSLGKHTVCGDVMEVESRTFRNGAVSRKILLCDYANSIFIKTYDTTGKYEVLSKVSSGDTVVVEGEVYYDDREHDNMFQPYSLIKVHRKVQRDDEPEKRIELHLHTNMSQMDAIPSAESAVMRAASLGHHAVAITDHGSVQAFPEACAALKGARKLVPDFKVIYGCEAYFVDDSANIILGHCEESTDAEVVCFDLETTGLDCENERIIEIGACIVRDGQVTETFDTFVDPQRAIPDKITEITGISDKMVSGAPLEEQALRDFFSFVNGRILVAHNASFDMSFLKAACRRCGFSDAFELPCVDTLALAQTLLPDLARHRLDSLTKYFKLPKFNHHRAADDTVALARIYLKLIEMLEEQGITDYSDINSRQGGKNIKHGKLFHMILLVKDLTGLKNLYTLVSLSNVKYFHSRPRIPLSELLKYREGLMIGSACQAGEVYSAILDHRPAEEIDAIAEKYDYFEIQPVWNNEFLVREGRLQSDDDLRDINRRIVELADRHGKPCVATCDVHFLDEKDGIYRQILLHGTGYSDSDDQAPLCFRTTREMLDEFSYLGADRAREVVITNPARIAEQIAPDIKPIPDGAFTPDIPGSAEQITERAYGRIKELYGDDPDETILNRTKRELDSICGHNYAVLYLIAQKLVDKSESDGYHVGSRGSVGSSYVAFLLGISEVNPLPVHYLCPECKHFEYSSDAADGFDLPPKKCPVCGADMAGDGHDIPFETFLGFKGDKQPDIDLNFSSEYQSKIFKYTEELFGSEHVFKAGTIMALQDKNALGYVKKYSEEKGKNFNKAELRRLALGCTGVKRSTGQHPGGMVVIPDNYDINDFTPVQRPADKAESDFVTTHFDFNSLHDTLLKLDELGHEIPTVYHYLEYFSGINIADVPTGDQEVFKIFNSPEPLGVTEEQIGSATGTYGIPEMGTVTSRNLLLEAKPRGIADLIQISGLSHGTGVWAGNAQDLIRNGTCDISQVIGTRDGIMLKLIEYGVDKIDAFNIMEFVRKNKRHAPLPENMVSVMKEHNVPEWYIDSCRKIEYMFPKAHAAAYITSAVKVAWFKLHRPMDFYAAYFTVRGCDTDVDYILAKPDKIRRRIREVEKITADRTLRTAKDEDELVSLQMLLEMKCRGFEMLPVDLRKSHWKRFEKEGKALRIPFSVLKGVGESAARSLYEAVSKGGFTTAEDLIAEDGVTSSLLDTLDSFGALGDLPKTRQLSFF